MASLVLGAIGGYFFGPIGFMLGSLLGNLLFPQRTQGPRLTDLHVIGSSYGQVIPIVYGAARVGGNVVWQTDLQEHKHESGGKGGPTVTTFSYSASFAVLLCEGLIATVRRVWADGTLIYSVPDAIGDIPWTTLYLGDQIQGPDPTMEAILGVGNVPGYRGMALAVFDTFDLTNYGNRIPNFNFEIVTKGAGEGPVHRVAEYHDEPFTPPADPWAYFSSAFGLTGTVYPYITHWTLAPNDPIRVRQVKYASNANVLTYDNPTLIYNSVDTPGAGDAVGSINYDSGNARSFWPIGNYVYADLSTTLLWQYGSGIYLIGSTNINAAIGAGSAGFPGNIPTVGSNFAFIAGVPSGVYMCATSITSDGKHLFVFTSPTVAGNADTWYDIVDGAVVRTGTISPTIQLRAGPLGQNESGVSRFENNANYMWVFSGETGHAGDPGTFGSVTVYKIDGAGNFALDAVANAGTGAGARDPGYPPNSSQPARGTFGSCYSPAEGYCGVVSGISMVLFSRLSGTIDPTTLASIVSDQSTRTGLSSGQIDVTELTDLVDGYVINQQQSARDNLTPLQSAYYFDAVEQAGVITFIKRGAAPSVTIPDNDLAAQEGAGGTPPALVTTKRAQEVDLPSLLYVKYLNLNNDYLVGTQFSQRQVTKSQLSQTIDLSIVMPDAKAKQIVNTLLFAAWTERMRFTFITSRKYDYLEPTDVVSVHGFELRILNKLDISNTLIQFDGVAAVSNIWTQGPVAGSGSGFTPSPPQSTQLTNLILLDIPMVVDTDAQDAFYAAMAGAVDSTWRGAALFRSQDNGATFSQVAASGSASVIGSAATALGDFGGGNMFDELNTVSVVVGVGGGALASAPELGVLNGANKALLGTEIIQYKNAVLTAPNTYLLSGLLRGRRGTEFEMSTHLAGDPFIYLPSTSDVAVTFSELGQFRIYKAVTVGTTLAAAAPVSFINNGVTLRPYAPVLLGGAPNAGNDIVINWTRRTRVGGTWADYTDVPLSEPSELYVLQVWNADFTVCARVVTGITSPTYTYTSAMQVTDFGAAQQTVYITVGQLGTFSLGAQANAVIPGGGGGVNAPLNPVQPYNTLPPPQPPSTGCVGNVINDSFTWGLVSQVFSPADFGPGDVWLIKIPVPATPNQGGCYINCTEFTGAPTPRDAVLSISKCGAPVIPAMAVRNDVGVAFKFRIGPTPYPQSQPTLLPSTDYYLSITTSGVSEMQATLVTKG